MELEKGGRTGGGGSLGILSVTNGVSEITENDQETYT